MIFKHIFKTSQLTFIPHSLNYIRDYFEVFKKWLINFPYTISKHSIFMFYDLLKIIMMKERKKEEKRVSQRH